MKKLTKKFKDVKVEITFAESKEYNTVRKTLIEGLNEGIKIEKTSSKAVPKLHKEQIHGKKGTASRKEVMSSRKKQMPRLSKKVKVPS